MEELGKRGKEIIAGPHESAKRYFSTLAYSFGYKDVDTKTLSDTEVSIILLGDNGLPLSQEHHHAFIEQTLLCEDRYGRGDLRLDETSVGFPCIVVRVKDADKKPETFSHSEELPDQSLIAQSFTEGHADAIGGEFEIISRSDSGWIGKLHDLNLTPATRSEVYLFTNQVIASLTSKYPDTDWETKLHTEETTMGPVVKFIK